MSKKTQMSNENKNKPFDGYYTIIGKACGCSGKYAKMVLENKLGKYHNRDTEKVRDIRLKAEEIQKAIQPNK